MTVSFAVPSRLVLISSLAAAMIACAGQNAPVSSLAEAGREPHIVAPPTTPEPPANELEVTEPVREPIAEVQGLAEVADMLARRDVSWTAKDTRMALARRGAVRLRADGPDHGLADGESFASFRPFTVVDNAEHPRVVSEQGGVRLLLFVDRADAKPIVLDRAPLAPTPGFEFQDPPRRGHFVLKPGTWVDVLERKEGAVSVRLDRKRPRKGWIDQAAVGTSFVGGKTPESRDESEHWLVTKRRTKLLARPGGRALVTLAGDNGVLRLTGRATDGHRLVEYTKRCDDQLAYVGFVSSRDLRQPSLGSTYGCGGFGLAPAIAWGDAESAPRVEIEAGRFLLDVDEPIVVGCVVKPAELADLGDARYAVATIWGPIPVRLAPDSVGGRCGEAPVTQSLEP